MQGTNQHCSQPISLHPLFRSPAETPHSGRFILDAVSRAERPITTQAQNTVLCCSTCTTHSAMQSGMVVVEWAKSGGVTSRFLSLAKTHCRDFNPCSRTITCIARGPPRCGNPTSVYETRVSILCVCGYKYERVRWVCIPGV
jgi:hypothetical protein